jgi:hypothetical protein
VGSKVRLLFCAYGGDIPIGLLNLKETGTYYGNGSHGDATGISSLRIDRKLFGQVKNKVK